MRRTEKKFRRTFGSHLRPMLTKTKIVKNGKLKISKTQSTTFLRTTEKKIQKKFEKMQSRFEGGVLFP